MTDFDSLIQAVTKTMKKKTKTATKKISRKDYLSLGTTQLNLACSGRTAGAIPKGFYALVVGDSSAGKTVLALTALAEAANNPEFDDYRLIHNNAENGSLMNIKKYFGSKLASRIEVECSETLEQFYDHSTDAVGAGPCVYILDSMDTLVSEDEDNKFEEEKKNRASGKKSTGTYAVSKPKQNSAKLRVLTNRLKKHNSILIIITQTRQSIGFGAMFNPKTRAGGDALRFYCRLEIWLSLMNSIHVNVNGQKRKIGHLTKAKIKKNHVNGWEGEVSVPIYRSIGVDEIGANIDYLIKEKVWKGKEASPGGYVQTKGEFGNKAKMKREDLIGHIQGFDHEDALRTLVAQTWYKIEEQSAVNRKSKYA